MKAFWQVVRREWLEWRLLIFAAFILGCLPIATPFLPGMAHLNSNDIRQAACLVIFGLFGIGAVGFLGSGLLARDLSEGKLSFFFARPISGTGLWSGKVFAAVSILASTLALILLPTLMAQPELLVKLAKNPRDYAVPVLALSEAFALRSNTGLPLTLPVFWQVAFGLAALCTALLLVHWAQLAIRSRSPWLLLDAIGCALIGLSSWMLWDALVSRQAYGALVWIERLWVIGLPIVLWQAGRIQLEKGRIDGVRSHRFFSSVAWVGILLLIVLTGTYSRWLLGGSSTDLENLLAVSPNPTGTHMMIGGTLKGRSGRQAAFMRDLRADQISAVESQVGSLIPAVAQWKWSDDGQRAVWGRCRRIVWTDCELWTQDLAAGTAPRATGIPVRAIPSRVALSHDGLRVAIGHTQGVEVFAIQTGAMIAALRTPEVFNVSFVSTEKLRLVHGSERGDMSNERSIRLFNIKTRASEVTGKLPRDAYERTYVENADGTKFLFRSLTPRRYELRDAWTGEVLADLAPALGIGKDRILASASFLEDGRLVLVLSVENQLWDLLHPDNPTISDLEVLVLDPDFDGDQAPLPRIVIPEARWVKIGPPLVDGAVTLVVKKEYPSSTPLDPLLAEAGLQPLPAASTYLLKLSDGSISLFSRGYIPVLQGRFLSPRQPREVKLFMAGHRALFTLEQGKARVVFPGFDDSSRAESLHFMF